MQLSDDAFNARLAELSHHVDFLHHLGKPMRHGCGARDESIGDGTGRIVSFGFGYAMARTHVVVPPSRPHAPGRRIGAGWKKTVEQLEGHV
jgi:hypothetical protein